MELFRVRRSCPSSSLNGRRSFAFVHRLEGRRLFTFFDRLEVKEAVRVHRLEMKEAVRIRSPAGDVISKRRHCTEHSSRVKTSVARAEEVLESTQADHNKEERSSLMQRDYDFVDDEGLPAKVNIVTHFCKESLQRKLRDWHCWLKAHYYIEGILEEVLMKSSDKRVTQENWELLLKFWERGNKVSEAERNKRIRGEDRSTHTLGAKSIARQNQDEREKLGGNYTTIGAHLKAHQTKSGGYPDEYTRAMCEKVEEACSQRELMNSSEQSVLSPILDEVYKGHHGGYERGRGLGCSRAIWCNNMQTDTSNETVKNLTLQLQNAKAEIESSKAVIEALRAPDGETQACMKRMEALLNAHLHSGILDSFLHTQGQRSTHKEVVRNEVEAYEKAR
ncbi:hypothetical protein Taro_024333, partial [Colocasia esculenta]|nr:hypothetical protein [Colocasia esculenta]